MEKELDTILQILEKASTTDDVEELHQIEEQLQTFLKIITSESRAENLLFSKAEISDRLKKLEGLIATLDSNKNLNNDLFLEFKQFIENRKFK